jgi:hypothetical protein
VLKNILGAVLLTMVLASSSFADKIKYERFSAGNYAYKNYNQNNQVKFAKYPNNCTNFVSQSIMAGFVKTTSMKTLYKKRRDFMADYGDYYDWYYETKYDKGSTWSEANSLYRYAKYTDKYDRGPNYKYKGPKFKKITYDTSTSYLDYSKVQEGDIIFMDWHDEYFAKNWDDMFDSYGNLNYLGKKHAIPDGIMDHALIVTIIYSNIIGYDKIRVASNSEDYKDKSLGKINRDSNRKALFYVYRPTAYIK